MMNNFLFLALILLSFGVQANPEITIASTIEVSPTSRIQRCCATWAWPWVTRRWPMHRS